MKIQVGDIIELKNGLVYRVVETVPNSAHVYCADVYRNTSLPISVFPLTSKVKKVLKRKAEIKRTRNKQFRFNLIGDNGEIIGTSEMYTTKAKAIKTVKTYHPTFKIIDAS